MGYNNFLKILKEARHNFVSQHDDTRNNESLEGLYDSYGDDASDGVIPFDAFMDCWDGGDNDSANGDPSDHATCMYQRIYKEFVEMIQSKSFYRRIMVKHLEDLDIERLGHSWCADFDYALSWDPIGNNTMPHHGLVSWYDIVIESSMDLEDIDQIYTAYLLGYYEEEHEVRSAKLDSAKLQHIWWRPISYRIRTLKGHKDLFDWCKSSNAKTMTDHEGNTWYDITLYAVEKSASEYENEDDINIVHNTNPANAN